MPLAILEGVEEDGGRPEIQGVGTQPEDVRADARQLAADDPDGLTARGHVQVQQRLHRESEPDVGAQRREVVHPIGIGDELQVGAVLGDLLHAPMQVADVRHAFLDPLSVELEHQAQHAVRRGVGRPHVDGDNVGVIPGSGDVVVHAAYG